MIYNTIKKTWKFIISFKNLWGSWIWITRKL